MSSYQGKNAPSSRPTSHVFPMFHSSLPYTLVRDFAYPTNHPFHYGPPPHSSGLSTPASDTRRLSDPAMSKWDDSRTRSATPPWTTDSAGLSQGSREQLPAMTFSDGGPPYSEDEDLHSPVVTTARHRKSRNIGDRGRSPANGRGVLVGVNGDGSEAYYMNEGAADGDGPGGEIVTYPPGVTPKHLHPQDRRSKSHRHSPQDPSGTLRSRSGNTPGPRDSDDDDCSETDDESRFSRNYSFTIASPDEEMHGKAVALFDFAREHENELPLNEGQIILVSYRQAQGWLVAQDPKTGESGLVPEEFVRLVRDIEGGLNGLSAQMDELMSPGSEAGATPTNATTGGFSGSATSDKHTSNGGNNMVVGGPVGGSGAGSIGGNGSTGPGSATSASADKHPSVQSSFSTSSKDLEKYPLQKGEKDENATPTAPHTLRNELGDRQG